MVAKELAYNIVVGAVRQSGVDLVFGRLNKDIETTKDLIEEAVEKQADLLKEIRELKRQKLPYDEQQKELEETQEEIEELTELLSHQREEMREGQDRINKWGSRMRWAVGIIGMASAALTVLIHQQGQFSRSLMNTADITGMNAQEMERLNQAAELLTGGSLSPETWQGIADSMRQLRYQFMMGQDLSEDQALAWSHLQINPFEDATIGAREWYEALQRVPEHLREVTAGAVGITSIYHALRPAIDAGKTWDEVLEGTTDSTDEVHRGYVEAKKSLDAMTLSTQKLGVEVGSVFTPILGDAYEAMRPFVRGMAEFVRQNPTVIKAIAALGIALTGVTAILWAVSTAKAFLLTLSGVGIPMIALATGAALGVAALGGIAFAGLGGLGSKSKVEAESAEDEKRVQDDANADKIVSAVNAQATRQEAIYEKSREELDPILRVLECVEDRVDAIDRRQDTIATGNFDTAKAKWQTQAGWDEKDVFTPTMIPAIQEMNAEMWRKWEAETGVKAMSPDTHWGSLQPTQKELWDMAQQNRQTMYEQGLRDTPNPQPGETGFHGPVMEPVSSPTAPATWEPGRVDYNTDNSNTAVHNNVEIFNSFYDNKVPASTIAEELDREMQRVENRR